ncbi:MAG: hypothetical protein JRM73_01980 [Nitrososphaerota archaeon]|nr:hypothetical protein [Nitrososphaerota archaeon]
MQEKRIIHSAVSSAARVADAKSGVATSLDSGITKSKVNDVIKPRSPSSAMKKAGIALIVGVPDPITAVPGVALVAASYASKRKEPASLADLAAETRKLLRDLQSLSL